MGRVDKRGMQCSDGGHGTKLGRDEKEAGTHFFKSSTDIYSRSIVFARSISAASARMQIDIRGRGTLGSLDTHQHGSFVLVGAGDGAYLTVPEKRLSRWGS